MGIEQSMCDKEQIKRTYNERNIISLNQYKKTNLTSNKKCVFLCVSGKYIAILYS